MTVSRMLRRLLIIPMALLMSVRLPCWSIDTLAIRYTAEMTHLPVGSDIVALGETGVVLPRHGVASLWNPATSAILKHYELSAEIADLYGGMSQHGCLTMAMPLSEGFGTSVIYMPFFSGAIPYYDTLPGQDFFQRQREENLRPDGSSRSSFSNNQHLLVLSFGRLFSRTMPRSPDAGFPLPFEIGVGCSFKSFWQTMKPDSVLRMGMGVNLDAGMLMRAGLDYNFLKKEVSRQLLFGVTIRDFLPSPIIWINSRDEYDPDNEYREKMTRSYYTGLAYVDKSGNFGGVWTLSAAIEKRYALTYHYGIEAEFRDIVAFRAGLSDKIPSVGAGIKFKRYFLDYTFRFDELAFSYVRLAFGVRY